MSEPFDWPLWEARFERFVSQGSSHSDAAHDLAHVRRVVGNARRLAAPEEARLEVVLPAAWLHDCVTVPKDSSRRRSASALAAERAGEFLNDCSYPAGLIPDVRHAIEAHSFSAGIEPRTPEARVVRDADRLDALGAIGIARCIMLGGETGRRLYDPVEPFPEVRDPDDGTNTLDHFHLKLLRLAGTMTTAAGRDEARRRTDFMREYLRQLGDEIQAGHEPGEYA